MLNNDLSRPTKRSNALPVSLQVLMALRYYATGSFQSVVGDGYSVSSMSVSRCVRDVSYFITRHLQNEIIFPLLDEQQRLVKQGFYEIAQFPHVLGTVDGTLVPIRAPHDDEHIYVTRKGFHALNIQGISDSNNMLLNLVVRWPGSTHDAFILANSNISEEFESGRIQGLRLALGAFRTSPVESLYAEAGEPSLYLRRKKLSLQYATRISSNRKNPAKNIIFKPSYTEKFVNTPKEIKPLDMKNKINKERRRSMTVTPI